MGTFVGFLDSLPEKQPGGVGTTGYCFGGRLSLLAAGTLGPAAQRPPPSMVGTSWPTTLTARTTTQVPSDKNIYVAGAIEDQSFPDDQKGLLETSLTDAGVMHTIETYPAHHGFAVPDNGSYDPKQWFCRVYA